MGAGVEDDHPQELNAARCQLVTQGCVLRELAQLLQPQLCWAPNPENRLNLSIASRDVAHLYELDHFGSTGGCAADNIATSEDMETVLILNVEHGVSKM